MTGLFLLGAADGHIRTCEPRPAPLELLQPCIALLSLKCEEIREGGLASAGSFIIARIGRDDDALSKLGKSRITAPNCTLEERAEDRWPSFAVKGAPQSSLASGISRQSLIDGEAHATGFIARRPERFTERERCADRALTDDGERIARGCPQSRERIGAHPFAEFARRRSARDKLPDDRCSELSHARVTIIKGAKENGEKIFGKRRRTSSMRGKCLVCERADHPLLGFGGLAYKREEFRADGATQTSEAFEGPVADLEKRRFISGLMK